MDGCVDAIDAAVGSVVVKLVDTSHKEYLVCAVVLDGVVERTVEGNRLFRLIGKGRVLCHDISDGCCLCTCLIDNNLTELVHLRDSNR